MDIFAIVDGVVLPYILDPNFEKYLPVVPAEVNSVNFTWKGGDKQTVRFEKFICPFYYSYIFFYVLI